MQNETVHNQTYKRLLINRWNLCVTWVSKFGQVEVQEWGQSDSEVWFWGQSDSDANAPVSMSELLLYRFASGVFLYQLVV